MTRCYDIDDIDPSEVAKLLAGWLEARCRLVSGHSSDIIADWRRLIVEAVGRAEKLGIGWDDSIVPSYVLELLREAEEQGL